MSVVQIPPSGIPAELDFTVPDSESLMQLSGIRLRFTFDETLPEPGTFFPRLYIGEVGAPLFEYAMGPLSYTWDGRLPSPCTLPVQARVTVNEEGSLAPDSGLTIHAWGFWDEEGSGSPDPGTPDILTEMIEVGRIEVRSWTDWRNLGGH